MSKLPIPCHAKVRHLHVFFNLHASSEPTCCILQTISCTKKNQIQTVKSVEIMPKTNSMPESPFHPQLLRLEVDSSHLADERKAGIFENHNQIGQVKRLTKVISQNRGLMDDSWINKIMWEELNKPKMKPKLILDLQDNQMHFEVMDSKDGTHLRLHARAMILARSLNSTNTYSYELPGLGGQYGWRHVSNDKHYSNRKTSQQLKSN